MKRLGARTHAGAVLLASTVLASTVLAGTGWVSATAATSTWTQVGVSRVSSLTGAEGLASRANGTLVHRGLGSISLQLRAQGWEHIGDPDIAGGDIFDAYQGASGGNSKMFSVTKPGGKPVEYTHELNRGELFNNSFATVSPDRQWLVSGEFGRRQRLEVFPAPLLNHSTPPNGGTLRQAGQIKLSRAVSNIQGCDFVTATELICSADDSAKDVFQVDLPHALNGSATTGQVTTLFQIPRISHCQGTFEAEGLDFDAQTQTLRVEIVPPGLCKVTTTVFAYQLKAG